jgi:hypothetical protein
MHAKQQSVKPRLPTPFHREDEGPVDREAAFQDEAGCSRRNADPSPEDRSMSLDVGTIHPHLPRRRDRGGEILLRVHGNTGGGQFNPDWVPSSALLDSLREYPKDREMSAAVLRPMFKTDP